MPAHKAVYTGWSVRVGAKGWPADEPSKRMLLAQQWTYGHVMGRSVVSTFLADNGTLSFIRQLAQMKVNHSAHLVYGRLMRPPGLTSADGTALPKTSWNVGTSVGGTTHCDSTVVIGQLFMANDGKTLPLPSASAAFESKTVPFLADFQEAWASHSLTQVQRPSRWPSQCAWMSTRTRSRAA